MTPSNGPYDSGATSLTAEQYALSIRRPPALPPLTEPERARAEKLGARLAPTDERLGDIITFGGDVQSALAQISKEMLAGVRVNTLDEVLKLSDGVLDQVRVLNLDDLSPLPRRTRFIFAETTAAIRRRVARFFKGYEMVNRQLDRQESDIFRKEAEAAQRYHAHAELERATYKVMLDARICVAAIEVFLHSEQGWPELERRQQAVADEKAAAAQNNRSVDFATVTAAERYGKYLERVEMKRASLQQVVLSSYQSGITTRMLQDNENIIRQKLSDIRTDLLPQWRSLITIAYNAYLQQGIAQFVHGLGRAERDLRTRTADQTEKTAREIADLMTRPTFDPVALKYHQDKLIGALATLKAASIEARRIRDAAEEVTKRSLDELGVAVANVTMTPASRHINSHLTEE